MLLNGISGHDLQMGQHYNITMSRHLSWYDHMTLDVARAKISNKQPTHSGLPSNGGIVGNFPSVTFTSEEKSFADLVLLVDYFSRWVF